MEVAMSKTRLAVPLFLFAICIVVLGCAPTPNPLIGTFQPADCPVVLPSGLELGDNFEFGYVTVPELHAHPEGPTLDIAIARFRSTAAEPAPDPLVLNTGGPGDSNLDQFLPLFGGDAGRALLTQRDVVIIELRGLRYSKPALACDEVFAAQLNLARKNTSGAESNQVLLEAMQACGERLIRNGVNLSAFNNVETAADIALIMTALGYDQFNLFGSSAGTMIAQHVMRDHPERVRSAALNAAVPIGMSVLHNMMPNAARSVQRLFRLCAADETCGTAYPDLEVQFFALVEQLNQEPVTLPMANPVGGEVFDFVLNGDRLCTWMFSAMYTNIQMPLALGNFTAGDFSMLQSTPQIFFPMTRFTYGLSYSIFLTEAGFQTAREDQVIEGYGPFADGISLFFSPRLLALAQDAWPVEPIEEGLLLPLKSDIPTLILNGELDHVIPATAVSEMAKNLSNGYTYLFPGVAHSPIDSGPCAFGMMMQFFADPSQAPDSSCVDQHMLEFMTGG
jgi:pimeloyl-ACP methyl ester carboxylesterase